jgi:hypothetical protein
LRIDTLAFDNVSKALTFPELLTELRIAQADEEMSLDKTEYSMDLLDSLRLSMEYIVY